MTPFGGEAAEKARTPQGIGDDALQTTRMREIVVVVVSVARHWQYYRVVTRMSASGRMAE